MAAPRRRPAAPLLAGGFEIANIEEHQRRLRGRPAEPVFTLGTLQTAWSRLAATTSEEQLRAVVATTPWGDPRTPDGTGGIGSTDLRLAWAQRVVDGVPGAEVWARGATALLLVRETLLAGAPPRGRSAERATALLGAGFVAALDRPGATLGDLRATLPGDARWVLADVEALPDLWRAEAAWWHRVEQDALGAAAVPGVRARLRPRAWSASWPPTPGGCGPPSARPPGPGPARTGGVRCPGVRPWSRRGCSGSRWWSRPRGCVSCWCRSPTPAPSSSTGRGARPAPAGPATARCCRGCRGPGAAPGWPRAADLPALGAAGRADLLAGEAELAESPRGGAAGEAWPRCRLGAVGRRSRGWPARWPRSAARVVPLPAPARRRPAHAAAGRGGVRRSLAPLVHTYATVPYRDVDPTVPAGWPTWSCSG